MNRKQLLIQGLSERFKAGIKSHQWIGAEFEHIVVDRLTLRTINYYEPDGIQELMLKLKAMGWQTTQPDETLVYLENHYGTITLEPGAQLELSVKPQKSVEDIDAIYKDFVAQVKHCLPPHQALLSCGYHPKSKIADIPFIPKGRYKAMSEYFNQTGRYAHNMMKGTASTQVGIDFHSEEDFMQKYRLFSAFSPFLAALFDSSAYFEGVCTPGYTVRTAIWRETDPQRSGVPAATFDTAFGFEAYAQYVANVPPILLQQGTQVIETGTKTALDLCEVYDFTISDYDHLLTMVFPDIRAKNFIEIRMADAMPYPFNFAFIELVHILSYHDKISAFWSTWSQKMTYTQYMTLRDGVIKEGLSAPYVFHFEGLGITTKTVYDLMLLMMDQIKAHQIFAPNLNQYFEFILKHPLGFSAYLKDLDDSSLLRALEVQI